MLILICVSRFNNNQKLYVVDYLFKYSSTLGRRCFFVAGAQAPDKLRLGKYPFSYLVVDQEENGWGWSDLEACGCKAFVETFDSIFGIYLVYYIEDAELLILIQLYQSS